MINEKEFSDYKDDIIVAYEGLVPTYKAIGSYQDAINILEKIIELDYICNSSKANYYRKK